MSVIEEVGHSFEALSDKSPGNSEAADCVVVGVMAIESRDD